MTEHHQQLRFGIGTLQIEHRQDELFDRVRAWRWCGDVRSADSIDAELLLRPTSRVPPLPARALRVGYAPRHQFYELGTRLIVYAAGEFLITADLARRRMTIDYRSASPHLIKLTGRSLSSFLIAVAFEVGARYLPAAAWHTRAGSVLLSGPPHCGGERLVDVLRRRRSGTLVPAPVWLDRSGRIVPFPISREPVADGVVEPAPPAAAALLAWVTGWKETASVARPAEPDAVALRLRERMRGHPPLPRSLLWNRAVPATRLEDLAVYDLLLGESELDAAAAVDDLLAGAGVRRATREAR